MFSLVRLVRISIFFIAFHILTCDFTSYMKNSIRFFLDLKMISERSKRRQIISVVFILK